MLDRPAALRNIAVGDIFHATAPNGASLICLTHAVTATTIHAETVTSDFQFEFERATGEVEWEFEGQKVPCTIDSVAPPPAHIHEVMLGLYRKRSPAGEEDSRLTEAERRGLVFVARYYPANPIPPPSSAWQTMTTGRKLTTEPDPEDYDNLTGDEKVELILINYLIPASHSDD